MKAIVTCHIFACSKKTVWITSLLCIWNIIARTSINNGFQQLSNVRHAISDMEIYCDRFYMYKIFNPQWTS